MQKLLVLVTVGAVVVLGGCASQGSIDVTDSTDTEVTGETLSTKVQNELESTIETRMRTLSPNGEELNAAVSANGSVILTGEVQSQVEIDQIGTAIAQMSGVASVQNNLTVSDKNDEDNDDDSDPDGDADDDDNDQEGDDDADDKDVTGSATVKTSTN